MAQQLETNAKISARLLAFIVNGGMTIEEAFNAVLGPGYYDCLVEELYTELRAKGGAA